MMRELKYHGTYVDCVSARHHKVFLCHAMIYVTLYNHLTLLEIVKVFNVNTMRPLFTGVPVLPSTDNKKNENVYILQ